MILGRIHQNYSDNSNFKYQFINWVIRTNKGMFISNEPVIREFNSLYSLNKSFDFVHNFCLTWYDSETIIVE